MEFLLVIWGDANTLLCPPARLQKHILLISFNKICPVRYRVWGEKEKNLLNQITFCHILNWCQFIKKEINSPTFFYMLGNIFPTFLHQSLFSLNGCIQSWKFAIFSSSTLMRIHHVINIGNVVPGQGGGTRFIPALTCCCQITSYQEHERLLKTRGMLVGGILVYPTPSRKQQKLAGCPVPLASAWGGDRLGMVSHLPPLPTGFQKVF